MIISLMIRRPPPTTLFPYTTLSRSVAYLGPEATFTHEASRRSFGASVELVPQATVAEVFTLVECGEDRKSTRLNSSHANISYAVFCLKKKCYGLLLPYTCLDGNRAG